MNLNDVTAAREKGNRALSEARALARYGGHEDELTKPSILLDWVGEDEVTVRWETVRRDHPLAALVERAAPVEPTPALDATALPVGADDEDFEPPRFRGIGGRAGGVILGVVLGVAMTIGIFALFAPLAPAEPNSGRELPVPQVPEPPRVQPAIPGPLVVPVPDDDPGVVAVAHPHRPHASLNLDATPRAHVILDGHPLGTTPQRVPVSPGEHRLLFVHASLGRRSMSVFAPRNRVTFATAKF